MVGHDVNAPRCDRGFSQGAKRDSRVENIRPSKRLRRGRRRPVDKGTALALMGFMPIATRTSTKPTDPHDASRVPGESRDGKARESLPHEEPLDVIAPDRYDNVACTD
jgi:hypothetical protein